MKKLPYSLASVALIFGIIAAALFKAVQKYSSGAWERREDLTRMVQDLEEANKGLSREVQVLREKLGEYEKESGSGKELIEALRKELDQARMGAGLLKVQGPGVEVVLQDSRKAPSPGEDPNLFVVHQEDILNVINELNAGGAEAIAVNDQRVVASSSIRCVGPVVLVNATRLAPPYAIRAIGDPDTLYASLVMPGGVVETLKILGLEIEVRKKKKLTLPPFSGALSFKFAKALRSS